MSVEIRTEPTSDALAAMVARRLVDRLSALQQAGTVPSLVLTGGSIADKIHEAVAGSAGRDRVDWARVDVWFGDERFVAADSEDRNALHATRAMLGRLPFDPARVHAMPAAGAEHGDDPAAAAAAYGRELAAAAGGDGQVPVFDVLMLGIGPDGHCASLFPGRREQLSDEPVVAVHDSPKPPPTRLSLTMHVLQSAQEVWWVAAGEQKADAVHNAVRGADPVEVPAAGPRGIERTLWLLDEAAASRL